MSSDSGEVNPEATNSPAEEMDDTALQNLLSRASLNESYGQPDERAIAPPYPNTGGSGNRIFGEANFFHFSENDKESGARHVDEGAARHGAAFPVFLTDSYVGEAIQRANALHLQRHGHSAIPPHHEGRSSLAGSDGHPERLRYPVFPPPASDLFSSTSPYPRESPPKDPVPAKFTVPGQETASVLQIFKRPRLRQKDIAHRQTLVLAQDGFDLLATSAGSQPTTLARTPSQTSHAFTPPRISEFSHPLTQHPVDNFMALLRFGQRKVGVVTSLRMSVHELQETAAQIAGMAPGDIGLMIGEVHLPSAGVLGDYVSSQEMRGTIISVVSSIGLRPASPVPRPPTTHDRTRSPESSSSSLSEGVVFRINLVYEDGNVVTQAVAPLMLVRQVRDMVALSVGASPDSVTLVFNGVALTLDHHLSDPPPLVHNSYVYIVRTIPPYYNPGSHVMPPRSPPPPPPTHGPALPPGFVRPPHSHTPSPAPAASTSLPSRGVRRRINSGLPFDAQSFLAKPVIGKSGRRGLSASCRFRCWITSLPRTSHNDPRLLRRVRTTSWYIMSWKKLSLGLSSPRSMCAVLQNGMATLRMSSCSMDTPFPGRRKPPCC
jgi:hypothetical protein